MSTVTKDSSLAPERSRRRYGLLKCQWGKMIECLIAYCTSSAMLLICNSCIIWYLWKRTVLNEIFRMLAISFIDRPSASICKTCSWRFVRCLERFLFPRGLQQITRGADPKRFAGDVGIHIHRKEDNPCAGARLPQLPYRIQAI